MTGEVEQHTGEFLPVFDSVCTLLFRVFRIKDNSFEEYQADGTWIPCQKLELR